MNNEIVITNHNPQDITITQDENQLIFINGGGEVIGITDVKVNGVSVVTNNIAYVIVPTKTSQLTNDSGYIITETDPTVPSYVKTITRADINNWNNKQEPLVSGTNIKTINNTSLLGSGNINITSGESYTAGDGIDITENVISNTITSYDDLTDLPTIPTKTSDLNNDSDFVNAESLAEVAFSGSYNSLSDTPVIPESTSDLINDSNFVNSSEVSTEIQTAIATKQDSLVSGTNIKTVNNQSLLGTGNLNVDTSVHTYNRLDILAVTSTSDQTYVDILDDITNDREFVIKSSNYTYDVVAISDDSGTISLVFFDFNTGLGSRLHRILMSVSGTTVTATDALLTTPSDMQVNGVSIVNNLTAIADIITESAYNSSSNKIATMSDISSMFESGTFTPSIEGNTTSGTTTYSNQYGVYYKIGKLIFYDFRIIVTSTSNGDGIIKINGLPYSNNLNTDGCNIGNLMISGALSPDTIKNIWSAGNEIIISSSNLGIGGTSYVDTNTTTYIYGHGFYFIN